MRGGLSTWLRQRTRVRTPPLQTPERRSVTAETARLPCPTAAPPLAPAFGAGACAPPRHVSCSLPILRVWRFFARVAWGGGGGKSPPPPSFLVPNEGPAHGLHPRCVVAKIWAN